MFTAVHYRRGIGCKAAQHAGIPVAVASFIRSVYEPATITDRSHPSGSADQWRPRRADHRPVESGARGAEPGPLGAPAWGPRHLAKPPMVLRRQPHALVARRVGTADDGSRASRRHR